MSDTGKRDVPLQTQIAQLGEKAAEQFMTENGYLPVCKNWRTGRFAELDLIFQNRDGLFVFVEVKTRQGEGDYQMIQTALENIHWRKRRKILIAARSFLAKQPHSDYGLRIDVVVVSFKNSVSNNGQIELRGTHIFHVPDAFSAV